MAGLILSLSLWIQAPLAVYTTDPALDFISQDALPPLRLKSIAPLFDDDHRQWINSDPASYAFPATRMAYDAASMTWQGNANLHLDLQTIVILATTNIIQRLRQGDPVVLKFISSEVMVHVEHEMWAQARADGRASLLQGYEPLALRSLFGALDNRDPRVAIRALNWLLNWLPYLEEPAAVASDMPEPNPFWPICERDEAVLLAQEIAAMRRVDSCERGGLSVAEAARLAELRTMTGRAEICPASRLTLLWRDEAPFLEDLVATPPSVDLGTTCEAVAVRKQSRTFEGYEANRIFVAPEALAAAYHPDRWGHVPQDYQFPAPDVADLPQDQLPAELQAMYDSLASLTGPANVSAIIRRFRQADPTLAKYIRHRVIIRVEHELAARRNEAGHRHFFSEWSTDAVVSLTAALENIDPRVAIRTLNWLGEALPWVADPSRIVDALRERTPRWPTCEVDELILFAETLADVTACRDCDGARATRDGGVEAARLRSREARRAQCPTSRLTFLADTATADSNLDDKAHLPHDSKQSRDLDQYDVEPVVVSQDELHAFYHPTRIGSLPESYLFPAPDLAELPYHEPAGPRLIEHLDQLTGGPCASALVRLRDCDGFGSARNRTMVRIENELFALRSDSGQARLFEGWSLESILGISSAINNIDPRVAIRALNWLGEALPWVADPSRIVDALRERTPYWPTCEVRDLIVLAETFAALKSCQDCFIQEASPLEMARAAEMASRALRSEQCPNSRLTYLWAKAS